MKKFAIRFFQFTVLVIALFLFLDLVSYFFMSDEILKYDQTQKTVSIINLCPNPKIIIAGDSRAERQIIPKIIEEKTGTQTVNIATAGSEIQATYNSIEKYNLAQNKTIILSLSSPNINDGIYADSRNTLAATTIVGLPIHDKIRLMKGGYFKNIFQLYCTYIQEKLMPNISIDAARLSTKGYMACEGELSSTSIVESWEKHPWYASPNIEGVKSRSFIHTLEKMAVWNSQVYVVNSPVAPLWRESYTGTPIDSIEKEYSILVQNICDKYNNLNFIDFYNNPIDSLNNACFYNMQHLNDEGAKIYTSVIIGIIQMNRL